MIKQTITALVQEAVQRSPKAGYAYKKNAEGIWQGLTFADMYERALNLAAFFTNEENYQAQERIAILAEGSPEWINVELGAIFAGAIAVPLSLKLLPEEILFRLDHCEAKLLAISKISAEKALQAIAKAQQPVKILWLDEDADYIADAAKAAGLEAKHIVLLKDALVMGKAWMDNPKKREETVALAEKTEEDDVAVIAYSSGTSGNPKGVMLTHANFCSNVRFPLEYHDIPLGKVSSLMILPCDHAFAHTIGIYLALSRSASLYFLDSRGGAAGMIQAIPANLKEIKPYCVLAVPALAHNFMKRIQAAIAAKGSLFKTLFNACLKASIKINGNMYNKIHPLKRLWSFFPWLLGQTLIFPRIRKALPITLIVGGGALFDRKIQEFFFAIGIPLYQGYGLTEASPVVSVNGSKPHTAKIGTAGRVFSEISAKIELSDGSIAKPGQIGEIVIKGPNIMKGYFKNEEATKQALKEGWLYTGDRGFLDRQGFLSVVGRDKALLINKEGEKYSPEEIEEAITASGELIGQALLYCDHNPYVGALISLDRSILRLTVKRLNETGLVQNALNLAGALKDRVSHIKDLALKKRLENSPETAKYKKNKTIDLNRLLAEITKSFLAFKTDKSYAGLFPKTWLPSTYRIIIEPFEQNSALKIMRHKEFEKYAADLQYMYTPEGSEPANKKNLQTLHNILIEEGLLEEPH